MTELSARFTSPGTALSAQAGDEAALERALILSAEGMLLAIAKEANQRMLTAATATQMWWDAVDAALASCGWPAGTAEYGYLEPVLTAEDLGIDAFAATQDVWFEDMTTFHPNRTMSDRLELMKEALGLEHRAVAEGDRPGQNASDRDTTSLVAAGAAVFSKAWRRRVKHRIRTGFTGLSGYVALQAMRSAGRSTKTWVTRHDDDVRSTHLALDGETVPLEQPFVSGPSPVMYPGDRSGAIGETINCRCRMISRS